MKKIPNYLKGFSNYFVDFFMAVIVGLSIVILLSIPMRFIRSINTDLSSFVVHFLSMCIVLYIRSYHRGYHINTKTYTFDLKKTILFVCIVFAIQIALIFVIGGHAVFISGPSVWLASYILPTADRTVIDGRAMIAYYDWLLMILTDIFIYAPIMIFGEYQGAKKNNAEN